MATEIEKVITELDEQIAASKNRLKNILSALNWTEKDTLADVNSSRKVKNERSKDEPALPESFGCTNSIVIDENQLKKIVKSDKATIPKKFSDIQLNYSREQKNNLYDYVISNTGKISEPELKVSVPGENQTDTDMTFAEIVAKAKKKDKSMQRKYRTSKPTHIEEVRNVVHLQMTALKQYFNPFKEDIRTGDINRRYSRTNDRRRLSNPFKSRSRSGDRKYHNESVRSRSKDKDRPFEDRRNKGGDRSQFRGEMYRSSVRRNGSRERSSQSRTSRYLDTKNSFRDERRKISYSRERIPPRRDTSIETNVFKKKSEIYRYPESRNEDRRRISNDNRYGNRDDIYRSKELKNRDYRHKEHEHLSRGKVVERRKSLSEHKSEHKMNLQSRGRSGEHVQNTSREENRNSDRSKPSPSKYKIHRNEDYTTRCNTKRSETPDNINGNRLDKKKKHSTSKKNLHNEKSYLKKDGKKRKKEKKRHKSGDRSESGYRNRYRANRSSNSDSSSSSSRSSATPKKYKKR